MAEWTVEEDDFLKHLTSRGVTPRQISALMLGTRSRSAVIGRQYRLGLLKARPERRSEFSMVRPTTAIEKSPSAFLSKLKAKAKSQTKATKQPLCDGEPKPLLLSLLDLKDNMCRWPVNSPEPGSEFLFCAHKKERGSSYCSFHKRAAWAGHQPVQRSKPTRRAA